MRWKRRGESVSWVRNRSFVQPHQARQQALTRRWRKTYDQVPSAQGQSQDFAGTPLSLPMICSTVRLFCATLASLLRHYVQLLKLNLDSF